MIDIHGAGHRYKEIAGRAADAIAAYRRDNDQLVRTLTERLAEAEGEVIDADQARDEIREAVRMRWDLVLEMLFSERWLRMGTMPGADGSSQPDADLREQKRELQRAFDGIHTASRKQGWFGRSR